MKQTESDFGEVSGFTSSWPGLASEVEEICRELAIENVNTPKYDKYKYNKILSHELKHATYQISKFEKNWGKEGKMHYDDLMRCMVKKSTF